MTAAAKWVREIQDPYQRTVARLMDKVVTNTETGCWEWVAATDKDGYGTFQYAGSAGDRKREKWRAHRASFDLFIGDIPDSHLVCHKCDNPSCVNPNHLFLGFTEDNVADRVAKYRSASGDAHGRKTMPESFSMSAMRRRRIVEFRGRTMTLHEISDETGVPLKVLRRRIDLGWDAERAVTTPPSNRGQDCSWWKTSDLQADRL